MRLTSATTSVRPQPASPTPLALRKPIRSQKEMLSAMAQASRFLRLAR